MLSDSSVAFLLVGLGANYVLPVMNKWRDNRMFWFVQATQVVFGGFALAVGLPGTETVPNVRLMAAVLFFGHFVHNFSKRMKVLAADEEDVPKPKLRIRPAEPPAGQELRAREAAPSEAPPSEAPPTEAAPSEAPPSEAPPTEAPPSEATPPQD